MLNGNRRSLYIFLTNKGKDLEQAVDSVFEKLEKIAFEGFSEEEQTDFLNKFYKIYINITEEFANEILIHLIKSDPGVLSKILFKKG